MADDWYQALDVWQAETSKAIQEEASQIQDTVEQAIQYVDSFRFGNGMDAVREVLEQTPYENELNKGDK